MNKKRILCAFMSFILAVSLLFTFDLEAEAVSQSDVVSQLDSYIAQYNGKTANSNQMYMGSQCKGFANWIFLKIFGVYIGPYPESANYKITNPNAETVGIIEPGNLNEESAKALLKKGVPGDYIQVQRSTARGRGPHSMILAGVNDGGIEVFDCNSDGRNTIKKYSISWSAFDTANRAMSLYHAYGYTVSQPAPPAPEPSFGNLVNFGDSFSARIRHCASGKVVTNSGYNAVIGSSENHKIARQIWKFTRNSNGSYKIQSCLNTDYCLDLNNFDDSNGGNVKCALMNGSTAQNWFIYQKDDGSVCLRPECSPTRVLDLSGGCTDDGNNMQVWSYTETLNQRFGIDICAEVISLGDDFSGFIMNSNYWKPIMQGKDNHNVFLGTENSKEIAQQLWHFVRDEKNGCYTIESYYNGKVLTVENAKDEDGANVICSDKNGSASQQWFILRRPDGSCYLKAGCSSRNLDLLYENGTDGTNIQMYAINNTTAQVFSIYTLEGDRDKISYDLLTESASLDLGEKTKITIENVKYGVDYKLHIVSPDGKTQKVSMGTKNTYSFSGDTKGIYKIYAEVKSPVSTCKGSEKDNYITIAVGYDYEETGISDIFQGHLYQIVEKEHIDWEQAKRFCENKNSYLSVITGNEENAVAAKLAEKYGGSIFLGGIRKDDTHFRWIDVSKEDFDYSNWAEGEPNNTYHGKCQMLDKNGAYGRENYIAMRPNGKWNDHPILDFNVRAFLMESEAVSLKVQVSEGKAYKMGELFKNGNTVVKAVFSDGTEREIEDYTVKGFNPGKEGSQNVEISYYGLKQSISVNVEKEPQPANPGNTQDTSTDSGSNSEDKEDGSAENSGDEFDSDSEEPDDMEEGDIFQDDSGNAEYEVIAVKGNTVCVEYTENTNPKASVIRIPATIEAADGTICKVTSVAGSAFRKNKKIKKVFVGSNVETIGANAFYGCKNLTDVSLGKNLTAIGANAFSGCSKLKRLTIPSKVKKIGSNAFYGCKSLKKLTVKTTRLTSKGLGKKAWKGIPAKASVRVPAGKQKTYQKLFYKKGMSRKIKIK